MKYELKALSTGEILNTSMTILLDNFPILFIISLLTSLPSLGLSILMLAKSDMLLNPEEIGNFLIIFFPIYLLQLLFSVLQAGLIIKVLALRYLDEPVNLKKILKQVYPMLGRLIGLSFVTVLLIIPALALLIIPGIIVSLMLILSTHVMVIENKKIVESMRRSQFLTSKHKGQIFLFLLIYIVFTFVISMIISELMSAISLAVGILPGTIISTLVQYIVSTATSMYFSCILVLIYFNQRIIKEGFDLEHLATQFSQADEQDIDFA